MGLSSLFGDGVDAFLTDLLAELAANAANTLLTGTGLEGLISNDIGQKIPDRLGSSLGADAATAIKNAVLNKLLALLAAKVTETFKPANQGAPANTLTPGSALEQAATDIANDLFGEIVNFTKLKTFLKGDIAATLKTNAMTALSQAGKALTTAALDGLSSWLDLKIVEEDTSPMHAFVTEAISGAGASNVGIAGGAAVAVITGTTKAYVSGVESSANDKITVMGETVIKASARQNESTVASSAVTDKGTADTNPNAGANGDTGNATGMQHESSTNGKVVVGSMTNGTVNVAGSQTAGGTVTLTIAPDEGYKLGATITATRSDTGATITLTPGANGTYTFTMPDALADGATINVAATFAENKHNVTTNATGSGAVTVKAPADSAAATASTAKMNDKLIVTVTAAAGYKLQAGSLKYSYTPEGGALTEKAIVTVESAVNNTYTFYMPDADVTIYAIFEADPGGSAGGGTTPTKPTNSSGKTVGVGASFALNIGTMTVEAGVGEKRSLTSGTLAIDAYGKHELSTVSVAGTDPLSGEDGSGSGTTAGKAKDISVDASVAVGLVYNTVRAYVKSGARITTTGGNTINVNETKYDTDEETAANAELVNFYLHAKQVGDTLTRASGFAVGNSTAVGAAVTVNIAYSDVDAEFLGIGRIRGVAKIVAHTYDEDDSDAIATAMGADLERYLSKFRTGVSGAEKSTNDILNGNYTNSDTTTTNTNNNTAGRINGELNNNNSTQSGGTNNTQANNNLPLSSNALRSQDTGTESTPDGATGNAQNQVNNNAGTGTLPTSQGAPTQGQKIQVAAAVSVNITHHIANASVLGDLSANSIAVLADNDGNFRSRGTGIAMSLASSSTSIALGVAVSVNYNQATATVGGTVSATGDDGTQKEDGALSVSAELTQNMDGEYKGFLGAQAIAGAVSGSGNAAIGGAIAIIVSQALTKAALLENAIVKAGNISVTAFDKSKLAVRAGAISLSTGGKVGVGASFALVYGHNTVQALVGDNAGITGTSFTLSAEKRRVDFSDYENAFGLDNLLTDSTGANVPDSEKGLVDIKKTNNAYAVDINISTDNVLDMIDLLNFLSSTNYYAEAIAGAISGGSGTASVAGAFAMLFFFNTTQALVGQDVVITLDSDMNVNANADTTARIIAGSLSASGSKVGVGLTVGALADEAAVTAGIGDRTSIAAGGGYTQLASARADFMVITVAASLAAGASGNAVGGAINCIVQNTKVSSLVGDNVTISAAGDVDIGANIDSFLLLISLSATGSGGVAAGGTFAIIITGSAAKAVIGDNASVSSNAGSIQLSAYTKEKLISALASASASTGGTAVAGTLNVLVALPLHKRP
jgi:hypothetical protein